MSEKGWKILLYLGGIFCLFILVLSIYGEGGWWDARRFQQEINKLQKKIALLREENRSLDDGIKKLRNEPYYIEKIAREELGMVRPGEKVFIITEPGD